jgi:phosphatidylglycerol:prolipoprotein diacylglycerol transferase
MSLPYWSLPTLVVDAPLWGTVRLTVFGVTAALGLWLGLVAADGWARRVGLPREAWSRARTLVVIAGFVGAHLVAMLAYHPGEVARAPWLLFDLTSGLSSTGGFVGGVLGFFVATRRRGLCAPAMADALTAGLLVGFSIGRLGCTLVHDHPGIAVPPGTVLAVGPWPDGTFRYDLGLLELLGCSVLVLWARRRFDPRRDPPGRLTVVVAILYALGRFPLDFLRGVDLRHGGLTFAQWACIAMVLAAIVALRRWRVRDGRAPPVC